MKFFQSIIFSFYLFCLPYATNAQTPMFQKTWGGNGPDFAWAVLTADSGFALLTTIDANTNNSKALLTKTDKYADTIWTKTFYFPNTQVSARSITLTQDGNLLVCIDSVYFLISIKVNVQTGNVYWTKRNVGGDILKLTYDGGYVTAGGNHILKYDSLLNRQIYKSYAGPNDHGSPSYAFQTTDSGFVIVGRTRDLASGGFNDWDIYLVKTDKNGIMQWDKTYGHASDVDYPSDIIQTPDGGYLICGRTVGIGAGGADILLIKTDATGNQLWCKTYGDVGFDEGIFIRKIVGSTDYYIVALTQGMETYFFNSTKTVLIRITMNGSFVFGKLYFDSSMLNISEMARYDCYSTYDGGIMMCGYKYINNVDGWIIKTDNQGNSGCNEANIAPIIINHTLITNNGGIETSYTLIPTLSGNYNTTHSSVSENIICTNHIITSTNEPTHTTNEFLIYPNPSTGIFTIDAQNIKNVTIYDVLGKQIFVQQQSSNKTTIDLSSQAKGIYFLQCVLVTDQIVNKKINIE